MPSFLRYLSGSSLILGLISTLSISVVTGSVLRGAIIDSENVCISVTVIGPDGGDPGTGCTSVAEVPSSSSSSSSSSSTTSASASSATSASSITSQSANPSGAYRYTRERSRWKIVRLLRQWAERNAMHAAPHDDQWYDEAVRALQQKGYVDISDDLRLNASATRAETAKLITLYSGSQSPLPTRLSFDDAITGAWYVPFIERAAEKTWMIGYGNCYGTHPCIFRPAAIITRAEAAATFVRVFDIYPSYDAPKFTDVPYHAWYRDAMQAAADACIVQGNGGLVRPEDPVTRAELFVMFYRAMNQLQYGVDCTSAIDAVGHPAATTEEEANPSCSASVPMCLFEALRADVGSVVQPFIASLLSMDIRHLGEMPASEWLPWLLLVLLPSGGIISFYRTRNHGRKQA